MEHLAAENAGTLLECLHQVTLQGTAGVRCEKRHLLRPQEPCQSSRAAPGLELCCGSVLGLACRCFGTGSMGGFWQLGEVPTSMF